MDLEKLLTDNSLNLRKEDIGQIIGPDQEQFDQLFRLAFSREMPICWRATWIMDYLSECHPWMATTYINRLWNEIFRDHPDGVTRSALRLLTRYEIPEEHQGVAADQCITWLEQEAVPVAIKVFSMEILLQIAKRYPDMAPELITILEEQAPLNSAGFKARSRHVIKALQKLIPA